MAKKIDETVEQTERNWFFPTLGVSVSAKSSEEALKLAVSQKEKEVEDVDA